MLNSLSSSLDADVPAEEGTAWDLSAAQAIDESLLADSEQVECHRQLSSRPDVAETTRTRLKDASESLEFKIDLFANGVHKLSKLAEVVDQTVDRVSEDAATALRTRDEAKAGGPGKEKTSIRDVLRALSRT